MRRLLLLLTALLAVPGLALAQPSASRPSPPPSGPSAPAAQPAPATASPAVASAAPLPDFLLRRVVEELAAEGLVLGRLGYALRISVAGSSVEVSLWDSTSSRVVRTTKVDNLAADREAAVATVTQVVANMVAQQAQVISGPAPSSSSSAPSSPSSPSPGAAPRSAFGGGGQAPMDAEARYRREAIGFGSPALGVLGFWTASRGELQAPLTEEAFCTLVNKPELYRRWHERRVAGKSLFVLGVVGSLAASALFVYSLEAGTERDPFDGSEYPSESVPLMVVSGGLFVGSNVLTFVGVRMSREPVMSENDAKQLAQKYNDDLRRKYGLPVAARQRARAPSFRLTGASPYVGENQAGFALTGRF